MARRPAVLLGSGVAGLVLFAVIAVLLPGRAAPTEQDRAALVVAAGYRTPAVADVVVVITWFGDVLVWAPILLVAAVALARVTRSVAPLVLAVVAGAVSGTVVGLTKALVERARPDPALAVVSEVNESFPSGHAANSATVYLLLAVLLGAVVCSRWLRVAAWLVALVLVVAIGASRVVLGVHYPTDVLGGWLLATSWLAVLLGAAAVRGVIPLSRPATGRAVPRGAPLGSAAPQQPGRPPS